MPLPSETRKSAGILIIGDEILSGKVVDKNSPFLAENLTKLGVRVAWIFTVPDDVTLIAQVVKEKSPSVDWIFTSGGIGPTHDDVTIESIAKAYQVPMIIHPTLEKGIKKFYGERCTEAHMNMARVPEGAELFSNHNHEHPLIKFRNIFIFPGVPKFLRAKFAMIQHQFKGHALFCRKIKLEADEGEITKILTDTLKHYPGVSIGSYPDFCDQQSKIDIFLEHAEETYLEKAYQYLHSALHDYLA